jgi:CHASE3 domain sensor protein
MAKKTLAAAMALAAAGAAAAALATGGLAARALWRQDAAIDRMYRTGVMGLAKVVGARAEISRAPSYTRDLIIEKDRGGMEPYLLGFNHARQSAAELLSGLDLYVGGDAERERMHRDIVESADGYWGQADYAIKLALANRNAEAIAHARGTAYPALVRALRALDALETSMRGDLRETAERGTAAAAKSARALIACALASAMLSALSAACGALAALKKR